MNKYDKEYFELAYKYGAVIACNECGGNGTLFKWTAVDDGFEVQCQDCDNTGYVHNTDQDVVVPVKDLVKLFVATPLPQMIKEALIEPDEDGDGYYITPSGTAIILAACNLPTQGGVILDY